MIKTIVTLPGWHGLPMPINEAVSRQLTIWQDEGKYTGQLSDDRSETARTVTRWEWSDSQTADAYKDLINQYLRDYYPDLTVDIVNE